MMEIKRIILEQLVNEARIAQISTDIKFFLNINDTAHSQEQKTRHQSKGVIITDAQIISILEKAKPRIAAYIIGGRIFEKIPFIVTEVSGDKISLAIVGKASTPYRWDLTVKTVWSERAEGKPFKVGREQLVINV